MIVPAGPSDLVNSRSALNTLRCAVQKTTTGDQLRAGLLRFSPADCHPAGCRRSATSNMLPVGPTLAGMNADHSTPTGPSDETKKKFREALEKKNQKHRDGEQHLDGQSSIHGAHGKADTSQVFRRKSG